MHFFLRAGMLGGLTLLMTSMAWGQATFRGMGHLPGGNSSWAVGVSGDGRVVAGQAYDSSGARAIRWTETDGLQTLYRSGSLAYAASDDGNTVVGHFLFNSAREAFRWTPPGPPDRLGFVPTGGTMIEARGVSGDGSVVVGRVYIPTGQEAVVWENGTLVGLGDFPEGMFESSALGVSRDGSVVVGAGRRAGYYEAMAWARSGSLWLPAGLGVLTPTRPSSFAVATSSDGTVIVGSSSKYPGGSEPFRWKAGAMTGLGSLTDRFMYGGGASGVSGDGEVVVGRSASTGDSAFRWTEARGMVRLSEFLIQRGVDVTGWTLRSANGISVDGQVIVGEGVNPIGQAEGFVAYLPRPCADGQDNDGDGFTDYPNDPGCRDLDGIEDPACQDGIDNDGDGGIDFNGGQPGAGSDPQCIAPWLDREHGVNCGLGTELVLLLPVLWGSRALRGHRRASGSKPDALGSA